MRIISKFHDYYDSAMGFGQDLNLVYRRDPKKVVVEARLWPWPKSILHTLVPEEFAHGWPEGLQGALLGFCGRFHWVFVQDVDLSVALGLTTSKEIWLTDEEAFDLYAADEHWRATPWIRRRYGSPEPRIKATIQRLHESAEACSRDEEIFRALQAPVFLATARRDSWHHGFEVGFITNPRLATLGFQHVLDPFTAFQEIARFLGSALAAEDQAPRTVGDDRTIAASKGFDDQSFRTQAPGSKKTNRKLNRERKKGAG